MTLPLVTNTPICPARGEFVLQTLNISRFMSMVTHTKFATQNSIKTGRPFQKGTSGNPGGRPKLPEELRFAAREYSLEAIEKLAYWMRSNNPSASIQAADKLLDRGWGKSIQGMVVESIGKAYEVTEADEAALNHFIQKEIKEMEAKGLLKLLPTKQ